MPPKLHDLLWEYHGDAMNTLGYSRGIPEYAELPIEQQAHLLPRYDEELTITETIIALKSKNYSTKSKSFGKYLLFRNNDYKRYKPSKTNWLPKKRSSKSF
jgi:hypothetical protein